ncbi:MAG: Slp family lipoprotein [Nitrospiraceae bacterium]|nr:Slp family lipoprotein [Nitrospiraceae bacterium]
MKRYAVCLLLPVLLTSCAHVLSGEYVQNATTGVSFTQIAAAPDQYLGKTFVLGGTIVDTLSAREGSEMEVVQNPVDRYGSIIDPDISEGRFLIETSRQLDPMIYKKGRRVTFAGKLTGSKKRTRGEIEYRYPVFQAEQIYLWPTPKRLAPYYPFYYDPFLSPYQYYFYDPYWYGPYYPRP